jgi:hypothetical protein
MLVRRTPFTTRMGCYAERDLCELQVAGSLLAGGANPNSVNWKGEGLWSD